jgi:hypothetical protein
MREGLGEKLVVKAINNEPVWVVKDCEGNEVEQIEYNLLHKRYSNYVQKSLNLNDELHELKKIRIQMIIGDDEFDKLDEYTTKQFILHDTYTISETLNIIYNNIIDKYIHKLKSQIKESGYYSYSDFLSLVYNEFQYRRHMNNESWITWIDSSIIDQDCKNYYTDKIKNIINRVIKEIEDKLTTEYGCFEQDTIIKDTPSFFDNTIKIPYAMLIKKIA